MNIHGICFLLVSFLTTPAYAYYGNQAQEAILKFSAKIEVPKSANAQQVREAIDFQIQHLMGTFQSVSFLDQFNYPGVLGEDYTFTRVGLPKASSNPGRKIIRYKFSGKVVFKKSVFKGKTKVQVPIKMPLAPDLVYELGLAEVNGSWLNTCTDHHYNSEGDFWYFWDPDQKGCGLKGNAEDILRIQGTISPLPNTVTTYPEYDLLWGDNQNGDQTEIAIFVGYIDDLKKVDSPQRRDDAHYTYQEIKKDLSGRGFKYKASESHATFRRRRDGDFVQDGANFISVYEKTIQRLGKTVNLRVQVLLADTSVDSTDYTFHYYLVQAMENADVVIYDGHSGLGGNLNISSLPDIRFSSKKYQILFFNGCSTYPYFNGMFTRAKGGPKSVDLVLSGLPTLTTTAAPNTIAFMNRFIDDAHGPVSYQTILSELEASNVREGVDTYLIGVVNDEDNKFDPRPRR